MGFCCIEGCMYVGRGMIVNECRKNVHPDIKYSAIIDSSIDSKRQRPYATKARFHFQTI